MHRKINHSHGRQIDYLNVSTETEVFTLDNRVESLGTGEQSSRQRIFLAAILHFEQLLLMLTVLSPVSSVSVYCKDVKIKCYNQSLVVPKPAAWSSNRCQAGRETAPYYHLASNYWARRARKEAPPSGRTDAASEQTVLRMDNTTDVKEHITLLHLLHHCWALLWHNKRKIEKTFTSKLKNSLSFILGEEKASVLMLLTSGDW